MGERKRKRQRISTTAIRFAKHRSKHQYKDSFSTAPFLRLFVLKQTPLLSNFHLNHPFLQFLPPNSHTSRHHIPHLYPPHTLRRPRQHQVTRLKRHNPTNLTQHPRYPKQHQPRPISLSLLPIDIQPQFHIMRVLDIFLANKIRNWQEGVKTFSSRPRKTFLLCLVLQIPRRHVNRYAVAGYRLEGSLLIVQREVNDGTTHNKGKFDFIVQINALRSEYGTGLRWKYRGGRFSEEERFFGTDTVELFYVVAFGAISWSIVNLGVDVDGRRKAYA